MSFGGLLAGYGALRYGDPGWPRPSSILGIQLTAIVNKFMLVGELIAALDQLLRRAKAAGAIRRDIVPEDIGFLINAVGHAGLRLEHTAPGAWRRYVEIVLAGLAPHGGRKLAHKPPTPQQLHDSKRSR